MGAPLLTPAQSEEIVSLIESGWTYRRIAARFRVSKGTVYYHALRHCATSPAPRPVRYQDEPVPLAHRNGHVQRRFTPEEDQRIEAASMAGTPANLIARDIGRAATSVKVRLMTLARRAEACS